MRLLRAILTATAAGSLLVGGTITTTLGAEEPNAATFTASSELLGEYVEAVTATGDGVTEVRADFQTTWTASDPRASGTATFGVNRNDHMGATVQAGTFRLENEGGSWEGTFTGFWDAAGRHFAIIAGGQGDYSGWSMIGEDLCACDSPTSEARGVMVPGRLPPAE